MTLDPTLTATFARLLTDPPTAAALTVHHARGDIVHPTADVVARAARFAGTLRRLGIGRGDRVVIAWPTGVEFVAAFWGIQAVGAVAVPAPEAGSSGRTERLQAILAAARPAAVTAPGPGGPRPELVPATLLVLGDEAFEGDPVDAVADVDPDDTAIVQFTSGSTLDPRGCILTHRQVILNVAGIADRLDLSTPQRALSWVPLYHDMGLLSGVVIPFLTGRVAMVLMRPEDFIRSPAAWLRAMAAHRTQLTVVTPSALRLVTSRLARRPVETDLSSLRVVICGAEPIVADDVEAFLQATRSCRFPREAIQPAYGLAEHVIMVTSSPGGVRTRRIAVAALEAMRAEPPTGDERALDVVSLGGPLDGVDVRVVDGTGAIIGDGLVGEVELRSGSVTSGYLFDPEATDALLRDGWLRTGDMGFLADGELFLTGRSKDVIIVGGRNVFANDVEVVVSTLADEGVRAAAAFGTAVAGTEKVVVAVEARRAASAGLGAAVRRACSDGLGVVPYRVVLVAPGGLPRTSSGKLRRSAARDLFDAGELGEVLDRDAGAAPSMVP